MSPEVLMKLYNIYTNSFYGSNLYHLFSKNCTRLYSAWNQTVRQAFHVDMRTHRYLIETISQSLHPQVFLSSRFVKFAQSMESCNKPAVRLLASLSKFDNRTIYGKNFNSISNLCKVPVKDLTPFVVKTNMHYFETPCEEKWRVPIVQELLMLANDDMKLVGFDMTEIRDLLFEVCTS